MSEGLLAAESIRHVCEYDRDEQPYRMTPKIGELYSRGVNAYLNDARCSGWMPAAAPKTTPY